MVVKDQNSVYGDPVARRRMILDAAAELLDEGGYAALTNRAVAKRAGISPGLIYQYFVDKQDVFIGLLHEAQVELTAFLDALPRETGVAGLLAALAPETTRQWARVGSMVATWKSRDMDHPDRESVQSLQASTDAQFAALHRALAEAAAAEGRTLREDPALIPYVWLGLMGLADSVENRWASPVTSTDLITFFADSTARAVLA